MIHTRDGKDLDTDKDLTAPERHILQKLFLWTSMATSIEEFKSKKDEALLKGWNNSGSVSESPALSSIIHDLMEQVSVRLGNKGA